MKLRLLQIVSISFLLMFGCKEDAIYPVQETDSINIVGKMQVDQVEVEGDDAENHQHHNLRTTSFIETFEGGSKGSYAAGSVNLGSGSWYFYDALIGTLSSDRKFNSKSARVRNGYLMMNFNMENGVSTVRVRHAKFGSDGNSSWSLISSTDGGASWQYVGSSVTTSSTSLNTVTYTINYSGAIRFGVYKTSGGTNRVNFDNIEIEAISSGGGGTGGTAARDNNLTFGNPSNASTSNSNNYLLNKNDFILSYNNSKGTPNWVSWHLSSAWTGSASRCDCFKSDTSLPSGFYRATTSHYTNSGFDRGHLCPSADRTYSSTANSNTFFMTNIAPQAADNNQRSWASLESYCRSLSEQGFELHIVAGVAGSGGTGKNGFANTINSGKITVPDSFWKVILILPNGTNDVNRVTTSTRVIAVNIPNDQGINTNWTNYRTSVDAIENLTGYDLLKNIPDNIESVIEARVDNGPTN